MVGAAVVGTLVGVAVVGTTVGASVFFGLPPPCPCNLLCEGVGALVGDD